MFRLSHRLMISAVALLVISSSCSADDLFVDTSIGLGQVGGFYGPYMPGDDAPLSYPPTIPPDNDFTFQNYFLGRTTTAPLSSGFTTPERRAFFMFDMSGVVIPVGEVIASVAIDLDLLFGGVLANFATGPIEAVEFSATTFSALEILDPASFALDSVAIWDTFGTGTPYGGFEIIDAGTPPGRYTIPLPGAIADTAVAVSLGEILVVTARLATYDPGPIGAAGPPAIDPYEFVFGLTDVVVGGFPTGLEPPELIITTISIPEPTSLSILLIGIASLSRLRRSNLEKPKFKTSNLLSTPNPVESEFGRAFLFLV